MAQSTYTYELDETQQNLLLMIMEQGNYRRREVPYSLMSIEGDGFNCTLYAKVKHGRRKCCIQGGKAEDFVLFVLEPQVLGAATLGYENVLDPDRDKPHGGSDESGKGDYFGPLVVASCYVDETLAEELRKMGVKDCKQMSDKSVLAVGSGIRRLLGPDRWAFVKIGPATYNRLYAKIRNINRLLAWAHGVCIESLLEKQPRCPRVVVDQFAPTETVIQRALKERGRKITVEQRHKAESDIAVAAASVVARELFLRSLVASLPDYGLAAATEENQVGAIPKGSSDPRIRELAEKCVKSNGPAWVMDHCKVHFQTTDKVLSACGFTRADLPMDGQVTSISHAEKDKDAKD